MVLPLVVMRTAQNQPTMVELKNGETYSGVLAECDRFMNIHLRDVICTSREADRFWKIPNSYIRGNNVKYLRLPDEVIELAEDEMSRKQAEEKAVVSSGAAARGGSSRGGRGGRGGMGAPQEGGGGRGRGGSGRGGYRGRGGGDAA